MNGKTTWKYITYNKTKIGSAVSYSVKPISESFLSVYPTQLVAELNINGKLFPKLLLIYSTCIALKQCTMHSRLSRLCSRFMQDNSPLNYSNLASNQTSNNNESSCHNSQYRQPIQGFINAPCWKIYAKTATSFESELISCKILRHKS